MIQVFSESRYDLPRLSVVDPYSSILFLLCPEFNSGSGKKKTMCRTSNRRGHRRRALQRYIHDPAESTVRDVPRGSNQGGVESRRSPGAHQVISCWRNPQKESVCWRPQGRHTKVEATTIYAVESMVMPARLPKIDQSAAAFCRHQPQEPLCARLPERSPMVSIAVSELLWSVVA